MLIRLHISPYQPSVLLGWLGYEDVWVSVEASESDVEFEIEVGEDEDATPQGAGQHTIDGSRADTIHRGTAAAQAAARGNKVAAIQSNTEPHRTQHSPFRLAGAAPLFPF